MSDTTYTREQVSTHTDIEKDCWIIVDNEVYNVTEWINIHPGGTSMFKFYGGKDASVSFHDLPHSNGAYETLKKYRIGAIAEEDKRTIVQLRLEKNGKKS